MRRGILILIAGMVAGVAAYACLYVSISAQNRTMLRSPHPELAWLQHEFKLSDAELARISQLHETYQPQCRERCRRINQINAGLDRALAGTSGMTPEIEKILVERAAMRAECQSEMLKHFFEVSRTMPPAEGKRYLAWVMDQTGLREKPMIQDHAKDGSAHGDGDM